MTAATMTIHTDCRAYRTDRPCDPHKALNHVCETCPVYDPVTTRVLVVKLDATGDVLRTTALLRPLRRAMPGCHVTWITRPEAIDVLKPNSLIDAVVPFGTDAMLLLATQEFDLVLNPDASTTSSRLATLARGREKRGFVLDAQGALQPLGEEARRWYSMGLRDSLKKSNQRTYQSVLLGMCGLPEGEHPIIWEIAAEERRFADDFARRHGLARSAGPAIGLNTGAGGRWRWKKWTEQGYSDLVEMLLASRPDARVLLYGGPEEEARNRELAARNPGRLIDTGTRNTLRNFGALVDLCDVMVTGDTMALHLATALGKRIVALFGPTSAAEIELYGRGERIQPEGMSCLVCYRSDCDVRPACMERVSAKTVLNAVLKSVERGVAGRDVAGAESAP